MHASSMENMRRCIRKYLDPLGWPGQRQRVIDLGSTDINGSYRSLFDTARFDYVGIDLAPGPGVDLVIDDPHSVPLADASANVVISGQMLEHNAYFWLTFAEKVRLLDDDGYIFMIAPSRGQIHRYPVDCYRFYPDAYSALARLTNTVLIDCWMDDNHWGDLVGVFRKRWDARHGKFDTAQITTWREAASLGQAEPDTAPLWNGQKASEEEEQLSGAQPYKDVLRRLHVKLAPRLYVEIGVRTGASLALARGPAIGVDPEPMLTEDLPPSTQMLTQTSDTFFASFTPSLPLDLAFIDGLHLFEQVLRDFIHLERLAHRGSVIVIDDIYPNHAHQACRQRRTRAWTGDVWKLHEVLQRHRPDLSLLPLDTFPTGLLLVTDLDPESQVLADMEPSLRREWMHESAPPARVLARHGTHSPQGVLLAALLEHHQRRSTAA